MLVDLHSLARRLGGQVRRNQILAPAQGHSHKDRSLSVRFSPHAPDGFLVHCFGAGDPMAEKDRIREILGLRRSQQNPCPALQSPACERDNQKQTARALAIWQQSQDPHGTPVETYLRSRRVVLPEGAAGEAVRYHPSCPFKGQQVPAMVCLVRDVVTNEPKAIHRTALSPDGLKATVNGHERLSLGSIGGGAIKLTPDEDVTICLGIGEGLESSVSLRSLPEFCLSPVWSLIASGGIERLPVLSGIESLWIAVDHDPAGLKAAHAAAKRWQAAGAEAFLITPSAPRADLNDLLTGMHHAQP
jgi:putative DNA primase/helicase